MSIDLSALKAVLQKLEAADLAIVEASLIPALLQVGISALPVADQALASGIVSAVSDPLQKALAGLLAKVPQP